MGSVNGPRVALITGGASGMGLAVATALVKRGDWHVHLLDINPEKGADAAKGLGSAALFHQVNIAAYNELAAVFDELFKSEGRVDFVFANAGIVEKLNLYETHPPGGPPPLLDMQVIEVNLKAVCTTSYLALHYLRQSPGKDKSLVMTASAGGLYPVPASAMYCAAKHGVIGFMRSITSQYAADGIRVNAICPGVVVTGLLEKATWDIFPKECLTPLSMISDTVLKLIDGNELVDAKGLTVPAGKVYGKAVEINVDKFYVRNQHDYCDDIMAKTVGGAERTHFRKQE